MLDGKLMLVDDDDGKPLNKVESDVVNSDSDNDVEVAYDEIAQFMPSRASACSLSTHFLKFPKNSFEVSKLLENSVEVLKITENKLELIKIPENKLDSLKLQENRPVDGLVPLSIRKNHIRM
ncbi:hypothetical protein Tco_0561528 [Tanacetum coccineum]